MKLGSERTFASFRAWRIGRPAVHLQRVPGPPAHAAGRVCPGDLQGATAQRGQTETETSDCQIPRGEGRSAPRRGGSQLFNPSSSEEGLVQLGGGDVHERGRRAGGEDRAQGYDHTGDLDERLCERQLQ